MQADLRLCWSHIPHCWKSRHGSFNHSLPASQIISQIVGFRLAETMVAFGLLIINIIVKILSYIVRGKSKDFAAGLGFLALNDWNVEILFGINKTLTQL